MNLKMSRICLLEMCFYTTNPQSHNTYREWSHVLSALGCVSSVLYESISAGVESCLGKLPDPVGFTWLCVSMASEMNQTVYRRSF